VSPPALKSVEPIAGYTLKERIGAGGYGEVWKVEAPGGLTKAMKFIFGRLGEQRAACELKALNRIKEVRHPFLLSLERIEVVDGQLVIITELAEVSLKDRFAECKAAGQVGIPRDELLVYVADAADALDYMREHYSLQHLDVKPENLLVVGGRVKVADFGLVKDIHDATVSLMGGLTPVYASPEVYEGQPSLHSDQYSLAIVYQEMLTGVLPFPGRTPAQLTAQHLNSRPRLTPLPPPDRATIARALAKDPDQRFPSCRAMVDALLDPEAAARQRQGPVTHDPAEGADPRGDTASVTAQVTQSHAVVRQPQPEPPGAPDPEAPGPTRAMAVGHVSNVPRTTESCAAPGPNDPGSNDPGSNDRPPAQTPAPTQACTEALPNAPQRVEPAELGGPTPGAKRLSPREATPRAAPQEDQRTPLPAAAPAVIELGPMALSPQEARLRPTLLLGIGGTAARALRRLRGRLGERFGNPAAVPAVQMVLVDTDTKTLVRATQGDEARALTYQETIALPLRPAHEYRSASKKHLNWLSRRWLYNIPRSLQTEGIRPLGRLALVDHSKQLFERLRAVLAQAADPQSLAISAAATGLEVDDRAARVFVVASISGGTGSGMALDLGYAVRGLLAEMGYADEGVCGILAHCTGRHPNEKKLAAANAYACLSELNHYAGQDAYLGDPACALPPRQPHTPPFHQTYLVPLGEDLDAKDFEAATALLAEYLYLNTVTAAGAFFERCRVPARPPHALDQFPFRLRTFGLSQAGRAQRDTISIATKALCRGVIDRWAGQADEQEDFAAEPPPEAGPDAPAGHPAASSDDAKRSPEHEQADRLQLSCPALTECVGQLIRRETGDDSEAYFHGVLQRYFEHRQARGAALEQPSPGVGLLRAVNAVLGTCSRNEDSLQVTPGSLQGELQATLSRLAGERASAVCEWILQRLDCPESGINEAQRATEWFLTRLRWIESEALGVVRRMEPSLAETQRALVGAKAAEYAQLTAWLTPEGRAREPKLARRWLDYGAGRLDQATMLAVCTMAQSIRARVTAVGDQLADLKRELGHLADQFDTPPARAKRPVADQPPAPDDPSVAVAQALHQWIPEMVAGLDAQLRRSLLARHGGLLGLLKDGASLRGRLLGELPRTARTAVSRLLCEVNVAKMLGPSDAQPDRPGGRLRDCLDQAAPRLSDCGGAKRLLAVCPDGTDAPALAETIRAGSRQMPTVLPDPGGELILCYEVEQMSLCAVAAALIHHRPDLAEIAARLHTRIDVDWTAP